MPSSCPRCSAPDRAGSLAIARRLYRLRQGVVDSCSLILLARIELLTLVEERVEFTVLHQVRQEIGALDLQTKRVVHDFAGPADQALILAGQCLRLPIISDDRAVLNRARSQGLQYYNALMLILALYQQGRLTRVACRAGLDRLHGVARYSDRVIQYGEALFAAWDGREARLDDIGMESMEKGTATR
jgi:hypothetical protein